jgi:hypothetical protein
MAISVEWLSAVNNTGWNLAHIEWLQCTGGSAHNNHYFTLEHDKELIGSVSVCLHGKLSGISCPAFQHLKSTIGTSEDLLDLPASANKSPLSGQYNWNSNIGLRLPKFRRGLLECLTVFIFGYLRFFNEYPANDVVQKNAL